MNIFDLVVVLSVIISLFMGWQRGLVWQLVQLFVLIVALYISTFFSEDLGLLVGAKHDLAGIVGFIIIFFVSLVVTFILGYTTRSMFHAVGLKYIDSFLGMFFGGVKTLLILGVLFSWFEPFNTVFQWVPEQDIEQSHTFRPLTETVDKLTPYFEELKESVTQYEL